ncbi:hypothetical protein EDC96DRAFT_491996 [Choanephora cucurbitarum]|nr:hypothetical protein EDC96DRAFT_491996 [Choanephora cucurbitarum]
MSKKSYRAFLILIITCLCISLTHAAPTTTSKAVTSSSTSIPSDDSQNDPLYPSRRNHRHGEKSNRRYRKNSIDKAKMDHDHTNNAEEDLFDKDSYQRPSRTLSKSTTTSSPTVVTTIIVVATGTPTTIYSDQSYNPANQQIQGDSNSQTASYPEDGNSTTSGKRLLRDLSKYHKLVIAFSIVGSVVGTALLIAGFVLGRKYLNKKKKRQSDEENQSGKDGVASVPSPSENSPPDSPSPPPLCLSTHQPHAPTLSAVDYNVNSPHLEIQYPDFRQNRTLSLVSQTTPSAPSAKELDHIQYSNPPYTDHAVYMNPESSSSGYPRMIRHSKLRPSSMSSTDLPPPPAYTPSETPSAPPLYILPTSLETDERNSLPSDNTSLRRHSITHCDMASELNQPISLRRGSGSVARVPLPP